MTWFIKKLSSKPDLLIKRFLNNNPPYRKLKRRLKLLSLNLICQSQIMNLQRKHLLNIFKTKKTQVTTIFLKPVNTTQKLFLKKNLNPWLQKQTLFKNQWEELISVPLISKQKKDWQREEIAFQIVKIKVITEASKLERCQSINSSK